MANQNKEIRAPRYEILRSKNDQIYFRLIARNGKVILSSETYKQAASAMKGIEAVRKTDLFSYFTGKDGRHYFRVVSYNNKIVGQSQGYKSMHACRKGAYSVSRNKGVGEVLINI